MAMAKAEAGVEDQFSALRKIERRAADPGFQTAHGSPTPSLPKKEEE